MLVLAIDTATADVVTGVVNTTTGDSVDNVIPSTRGHNEQLVPAIQEALGLAGASFADLGAVVVGQGPGPFTSLRIGMATASAIGQARGIPVYGVITHDAIAARVAREADASRIAVVTDARRKEIYWATYLDGVRSDGPSVIKPAEWVPPHELDVISVPENLSEQITPPARRINFTPRAEDLVAVADLTQDPTPLEPYYLRRPDATPPAPTPPSPAIPDVQL